MARLPAFFLAFACLAAAAAAAGQPEFRDGWVRSAPPGAKVLAAYGVIHNPGDRAITVNGARSADFDHAALHEMSTEQGVMRMRELAQVEVPARADLALEPGKLHLMLFDPKRTLKAGDHVPLELSLQDGSVVAATLEVK